MKITAIEIKPGMIIEHKNDYWNVLKTQHVNKRNSRKSGS